MWNNDPKDTFVSISTHSDTQKKKFSIIYISSYIYKASTNYNYQNKSWGPYFIMLHVKKRMLGEILWLLEHT